MKFKSPLLIDVLEGHQISLYLRAWDEKVKKRILKRLSPSAQRRALELEESYGKRYNSNVNKNTRQRLKEYHKECKKSGHWPTKGYKKKSKPFPNPNHSKKEE